MLCVSLRQYLTFWTQVSSPKPLWWICIKFDVEAALRVWIFHIPSHWFVKLRTTLLAAVNWFLYSYIWLQVTPWSWTLLEKLIVTQLVKELPFFYGTRRFITAFSRARHWSLSWARWIKSKSSCPIFLRSSVILFPSTSLSSKWSLSFKHPNQILYKFLVAPVRATYPANLLDNFMENAYEDYVTPHYLIFSSVLSLPLRSRYSSQHPVCRHLHSTFFPSCDRSSFTPIQNNSRNSGFVYFNLYVLREETEDRRFWAESL
jgi:hypothetical protein